MAGVKLFAGFFKKDFCCALTIKFQNFLSACNFAVNAEMPDRIRVWNPPLSLCVFLHARTSAVLRGSGKSLSLVCFAKLKSFPARMGAGRLLPFQNQ